ncbi:PAS domain-containing sensor histidine kinase [Deinococcus reticulitermitis]|uniref:PAS domain-containing sensor histidine kinase n=1 Tax=Deinococcus reticulitermitis TaxID=856736 RepID=UPI001FE1587D|nr:PAS domain-containing sensor histidine kinase [Deinococcus reticulitermitis]
MTVSAPWTPERPWPLEWPGAALLAALPDPVLWLRAPDGEGAAWTLRPNAAATRAFGLAGEGPLSALDPDLAAHLSGAAARAVAGETAQLQAGGWALTVSPVGGEETAVWAHLRAASGREEREEAERLHFATGLLDRLGLGVTVHGAEGEIVAANTSAERILGLTQGELCGRTPGDPRWQVTRLSGSPLSAEDRPALVALRTGEPQRDVPMWVARPGSGDEPPETRRLSVTALPAEPGDPWPGGVAAIFRDDTQEERLRAELRLSERRYRSLVQASTQIVWSAASDGVIRAPQPQWEAFTGQRPSEYLGGGWLDAVHPGDRERTLRAWSRAVRGGQTYETEHRLRRYDGVYVPMQVRAVQVREDSGEVAEWIGTHRDVSFQRAAEDALESLSADLERRMALRSQELGEVSHFLAVLLNSAGEGIFGLDAEGRNTFVNPAASQLLGYEEGELLGQKLHGAIHHRHADGAPFEVTQCPIHGTLRDGQERRVVSDVFWRKGGEALPVSYVVTPIVGEEGAVTGAIVMFQDVTEQLRARQDLEEALERLQRSNAELEQFARVASHDLQEPLRTLGSYAELLSRRYRGRLDARADQYLEFMLGAVRRMRSLLEDLLAFSRVGRQALRLRTVGLHDLLQEVAAEVAGALERSGGELEWDTPGQVHVQPSLVVQAMTHLVANALKFHRPGVAPRVEVRARRWGKWVSIDIRDNGIGIEAEYHERVFTIFQRLHLRERYPGNGIGLAISRKIVEAHGGTLTLRSVPGEGSTFTLTLPAAGTGTPVTGTPVTGEIGAGETL